MGVYLKRRIKDGWKAKERGRYGECLVVIFCDEKTHKELFHYAMYLHDIEFWLETIQDLKVLDELHKAILTHIEKVKSTQTTIELNKMHCGGFQNGLERIKEK